MSRDLLERRLSLKTDVVEFCADMWNIDGTKVFNTLDSTGVLEIIDESYDILHTVGNKYLVHWVEEALESRSVNLDDIKK